MTLPDANSTMWPPSASIQSVVLRIRISHPTPHASVLGAVVDVVLLLSCTAGVIAVAAYQSLLLIPNTPFGFAGRKQPAETVIEKICHRRQQQWH